MENTLQEMLMAAIDGVYMQNDLGVYSLWLLILYGFENIIVYVMKDLTNTVILGLINNILMKRNDGMLHSFKRLLLKNILALFFRSSLLKECNIPSFRFIKILLISPRITVFVKSFIT